MMSDWSRVLVGAASAALLLAQAPSASAEAIPGFPAELTNEHMHWHHARPRETAPGGQFLTFHRDFCARSLAWYATQPSYSTRKVAPWTRVPDELKRSDYGWNANLAAAEQRLTRERGSFASAEALGTFIQRSGLHGYLHEAAARHYGDQMLRDFNSNTSTIFYRIHGLVDHWWGGEASFNGDRKADLLFFEPGDNSIHVSTSTGSGFGGAGSGRWVAPNGFGGRKDGYFPGDFTGDGVMDLGYLEGDHSFHVLAGDRRGFGAAGSGRWIAPVTFGGLWGHYHVGDFNGDGADDLLFVEPADNTIHVNLSTGGGFWAPGTGRWIAPNGFGSIPGNYFVADFNGDGLSDLGFRDGNGAFWVTLSSGSSFGAAVRWLAPNSFGGSWGRHMTGDFNGDRMDDLAFFEPGDNTFHVSISTGAGFGGPGTGRWIESNAFGSLADRYFAADFDGDSRTDLGYSEPADGSFHVQLSGGNGFSYAGRWVNPGAFGHAGGRYYVSSTRR
jgi:hypothetical protein